MPSTRSFITLFLLGALVPLFNGLPISYPDDERVHPRISYPDEPAVHPRQQAEPRSLQRRSLHPADVNVNAGMVPRSLHAQVPLNSALEPRSLDEQDEGIERRHLHVRVPLNEQLEPRHLHAQVPLNAEIEPRDRRIYRRHLYAQVPLNSEIEPRKQSRLERRGLEEADEVRESLSRRTIIPFTVHRLWGDLNWRPRIYPFQSVPSWTFSAPGFKSHHIKHAGTSHHGQIDQNVHKKVDDPTEFLPPGMRPFQRDPALVLQPRKSEPKMKSWSMTTAWNSEEKIVNGHRDAKAQQFAAWRSSHLPSEAEAKKNGGKPVESGEAVLITAKTPKEGSGAHSQSSGKPEVTVEYAKLGDKEPEGHKDATPPAKPASPSGAGAVEGEGL